MDKNKDSKMEEKIYAALRKHRLPLKKREELIPDLLALLDVVGQSEQLKAFSEYAQKRMWEDGDKELSEFVDEFLSL